MHGRLCGPWILPAACRPHRRVSAGGFLPRASGGGATDAAHHASWRDSRRDSRYERGPCPDIGQRPAIRFVSASVECGWVIGSSETASTKMSILSGCGAALGFSTSCGSRSGLRCGHDSGSGSRTKSSDGVWPMENRDPMTRIRHDHDGRVLEVESGDAWPHSGEVVG